MRAQWKPFQILVIVSLTAGMGSCATQTSDDPAAEARITVPAGARIRVALMDGISTAKNSLGDPFFATLAEPLFVDTKLVLEKGTRVQGRVVHVQESGQVKSRASIRLILTDVLREGKIVPISTKPFTDVAEDIKSRDAGVGGGSTGIGAVIGAVTGVEKGAAGALSGTGSEANVPGTKRGDIELPPETRLSFVLARPVEM